MPKCADCGREATPSNVLYGGYGRLVCSDCLKIFLEKEHKMCTSFKNGFDFVVHFKEETGVLFLKRKNGTACSCPYSKDSCASACPHFVIENCSIVDKKCSLVLTCGKHLSRVVEII